ncbi:MAG TPA: AAA family ATPase [Ktedonobacterales bacterium]
MILLRSLDVQSLKHLHDIHLEFPPHGGVLIEGANESGKSTLFEAIYFALYGAPLVSEDGPPSLAVLIPHEGTSAQVSLRLVVGETELEVRRTLTPGKRGAQHDARLLMRRGSGVPEEVYGSRAVTERIIAELHGLDGDALRNSCLMEQGALDRLESLSRSQREEAIAKLLGLERLITVERELWPTGDERAALERARAEHEVAQQQEAARVATAKEAIVATRLRSARANAALVERESLAARLDEHARQTDAMTVRMGELEDAIAHAGQVSRLIGMLDADAEQAGVARALASEMASTHERLAELDHIADHELPQAQARVTALQTTEAHLATAQQARAAFELAARRLRVADLDDRIARDDLLLPAVERSEARQRDLVDTQQTLRLAQAAAAAQAATQTARETETQAETNARAAQHAAHQANVRDIIAYWVRLKEVEHLRTGEDEARALAFHRDHLTSRLETLSRRQWRLMWLIVLCFLLFVGLALGSTLKADLRFPLQIGAVASFVLLWIVGIFYGVTMWRARNNDTHLRETERKLTRASIRSEAATLLGGSIEELPQVEADLHTAGQPVPASIEDGRTALDALIETDPITLTEAQERARQALLDLERARGDLRNAESQAQMARDARGGSRATVEELTARVATAQQAATSADQAAQALLREPFTWPVDRAQVLASRAGLMAERAEVARTLGLVPKQTLDVAAERQATEVAQQVANQADRLLTDDLAALDLPEDASVIAAARGATEADVARLSDRLAAHAEVKATYAAQQGQADLARVALLPTTREAWSQAVTLALAVPTEPTQADDLPSLLAHRDATRTAADDELARLDEPAARAELAGLRERHAAHVEHGVALSAQHAETRERVRTHLSEQGIAVGGHEPVEHLVAAWPLLAEVDHTQEPPLAEAHAEAQRETHFATRTATELAAKHGLDGVDLDPAATEARLREGEASLRQREMAASLAREARSRIVRRVLPQTEAHMRALLPDLTAGRYRDLTLLRPDDDPLSADLRIRVWDQAAGRYVAKALFSGGARDQFSLALRLAFALATLPEEMGATPGFIFLDEPTSAFDTERADALVQVLTTGEIGRHFAQVFLISHNTPFDPSGFHYLLRMGAGSIVESTLPDAATAAQLWAEDAKVG